MRIHINLSSTRMNAFARAKVILITTMKLEDPRYINEPNFMASGIRRCDYVIGKLRDRSIARGRIYGHGNAGGGYRPKARSKP